MRRISANHERTDAISPWHFLNKRPKRATYRAPEYNVPPFWTPDQPGRQFLFIHRLEKYNHGRRRWDLTAEKKLKMSQPIRCQGGHLVFLIGPKNTNLVEDVEILLPVKFRWIPFSSFSEEVENVSANQRPGRPSCFSDWPEKHKLGRGRWDLASCQVSLNSVQQFQWRSQKCLSQSEAWRPSCFSYRPEKQKNW